MIFSSIEFLLWFLPIFLIVYGITPRKYRNLTLLVGSIVFYARGDVRYLPLLMISILCNYFLGLHLAKRSPKTLWRKKLLLILTLGANLAVLLWFKDWGGSAGLPLGISFYTFQILSYQIDVYRGEVSREYSFLKFATYVIMFPKLILDEPTAGLDPQERIRFRNMIAGFAQDRLVILSTHIVSDVEHMATKVILFRAGKIAACDTIDEICKTLDGKVCSVTVSPKEAEEFQQMYLIADVQPTGESVQLRLVCPDRIPEGAAIVNPELEDAYLFYCGKENPC